MLRRGREPGQHQGQLAGAAGDVDMHVALERYALLIS